MCEATATALKAAPMGEPERVSFYRYRNLSKSLDSYIQEQIRIRLNERKESILDERNTHKYRHGNRWALKTTGSDDLTEIRSMGAESLIHTDDIINHDISVIEKQISTIVEQLHNELMKHLFTTVGEAADAIGNTIGPDDHTGGFPAAFMAMLEKIEFGNDRHGRASRPTMFVPPSRGSDYIDSLTNQPPEYHAKVDHLMLEKEKRATANEADRISRFRWKRS